MPADRLTPVFALNIAATPHPAGVYIKLLTAASRFMVPAHGSDYARISSPKSYSVEGVHTGRILVWTEIDLKGKWYDVTAEAELSEEIRATIVIPPNAKPNYRVFNYVFNEKRHRLYFEAGNEFGKSLGPTVALRIFRELFSQELQGLDAPNVEVTLVPREGSAGRVLGMPGLRKLTMRVVLPNPDATDPATLKRVRKRLTDAKAKQLEETYIKQAGAARLVPTKEMRDTAAVAAENGFVKGEGVSNGKPTLLATSDEPRRELVNSDAGTSFVSRLLASVGLF